MNRIEVNDSNIALMESKKLDSRYEVSAPPNDMASGNDIISTMHHIHKTIAQYNNYIKIYNSVFSGNLIFYCVIDWIIGTMMPVEINSQLSVSFRILIQSRKITSR